MLPTVLYNAEPLYGQVSLEGSKKGLNDVINERQGPNIVVYFTGSGRGPTGPMDH